MSIEMLLQETKDAFQESLLSEEQIEAMMRPVIEKTEVPERKVRRFMIRRLVVGGSVECDLEFKSGVNIIKAGNQMGKTSILNIIKLAITQKDKLDARLKDKVKEVLLEFQMDQKIYTVYNCRYKKRGSKPAWAIYEIPASEVIPGKSKPLLSNKEEFKEFFMTQFGLPKITQKRADRGRLGYNKTSIGLGDYFRAFYQDQEKGYIEVMNNYRARRIAVMSVMMGLHESELLYEFDYAIAEKQKEIIIQERNLQVFEDYLKLRAGKFGLVGDIDTQIKEWETIQSKKKEDLARLNEQRETYSKKNIYPLLEDIDSLEDNIRKLEEERYDLQKMISELKDNKIQLTRDISWKEENIVSFEIFRPYDLRICPRCENKISGEKLRLEKETQRCALCGNKIEPDEEKIDVMKEEILDRTKRLEKISNRISEYEKSLENVMESIGKRKENRNRFYENLEKHKKQMYEEFADITNLTEEITRVEDNLSEFYDLRQDILKIQDRISLSKQELDIMKHFEKLLKKRILEEDISTKKMGVYMKEFLEIAMRSGFESIELDDLQPKIDDIKFDKLPVGQKVRALMATYYGLLMMGLNHNGRLPCFLIIDSPRQHEMQEDFIQVVHAYRNLDETLGGEVQVIIASADPSIKAATSDSSKIMEFGEGERILKEKAPEIFEIVVGEIESISQIREEQAFSES